VRVALVSNGVPFALVNIIFTGTDHLDPDPNQFKLRRARHFSNLLLSSLSKVQDAFSSSEVATILEFIGIPKNEATNLSVPFLLNLHEGELQTQFYKIEASIKCENRPLSIVLPCNSNSSNSPLYEVWHRLVCVGCSELVDRLFLTPIPQVFSWGIIDDHALKVIADYGPLIEIGAGTGYMANQMCKQGIDIICFDRNPFGGIYHKVAYGTPDMIKEYSERTLFLSWPDAWPCEGSFGVDCMKAYKGSHLIYIGECVGNSFFGDFGKTASKAFHIYLDAHFVLEMDVLLPVWPGHRDKLTIWKRKEP